MLKASDSRIMRSHRACESSLTKTIRCLLDSHAGTNWRSVPDYFIDQTSFLSNFALWTSCWTPSPWTNKRADYLVSKTQTLRIWQSTTNDFSHWLGFGLIQYDVSDKECNRAGVYILPQSSADEMSWWLVTNGFHPEQDVKRLWWGWRTVTLPPPSV